MAKLIAFSCPVCGKNLTASSKEEATRCVHCGKLLLLSSTLDPVGDLVVVPVNDQICQAEVIATDQPKHVKPANKHKLRPSRLCSDSDQDLNRFVQYLYMDYMAHPMREWSKWKYFKPLTFLAKSVVEQIDEILQENISGTPLDEHYIRLLEDPSAGVIVQIDQVYFSGVNSVTDPEIKAAIKAAVSQWDKEQLNE